MESALGPVGGPPVPALAHRCRPLPDRVLHHAAEDGTDELASGSARPRRAFSGTLERTSFGPVGSGRTSGLGCAGSRGLAGPTVRVRGLTTARRLGGCSSAGNRVPRAGTAGDRWRGSGVGAAHIASASSAIMACRSGWAPRVAVLGRDQVHRARGRRREDQHRPTVTPGAASATVGLHAAGGYRGRFEFRVSSGVICWAKGVPAISRRQSSRPAEPEISPT
jgi:hypothetical protein